jgi:hypothetical protein
MPDKILAIHSQQGTVLQGLSSKWTGIVNNQTVAPYSVLPMFGAAASRRWNSLFQQTVSDTDVVMITGLAHGSDNQFTGFKGEPLYRADPHWPIPTVEVMNKIVHLLSCSTANGLDKAFIAAKARAFIGYCKVVPLEQQSDAWTTKLLTCDAQIEFSLIKGRNVSTAVQDAKIQFNLAGLPNIGAMLKSNPDNCPEGLPAISPALGGATLATRALAARALPDANLIAVRNLGGSV